MIEALEGAGALEEHLAHVGDVKQATGLPHGHMLRDYAGAVLHGEEVPCKRNDLAAAGDMLVIQGRFLFHSCILPFCFKGIQKRRTW